VKNRGDLLGKGGITRELTTLDRRPNQFPLALWNRILQEFTVSLASCRLVSTAPLQSIAEASLSRRQSLHQQREARSIARL